MFLKNYLVALPLFLALDFLWLGFVAKSFYAKHLGALMKTDINWTAAALFYLLFIAGLVLFVILPASEKKSWLSALLLGAFFGLVSYATYDLTNLATLKNWPLIVTIVDLAWGSILGATVSVLTYFIITKLG